MKSLSAFWGGMGNIFKTVVTLIIAADIFSKGLFRWGLLRVLFAPPEHIGLEAVGCWRGYDGHDLFGLHAYGKRKCVLLCLWAVGAQYSRQIWGEKCFYDFTNESCRLHGTNGFARSRCDYSHCRNGRGNHFEIVKRNLIPLGVALLVMLLFHFI